VTETFTSSFGGLLNPLFRRRMPEVLQFEVTECGTCCLAMVLSYFGRWEPLDLLRQLCGASRDGVSAGALARAAKQLNMNVKGFGVKADELANLPMPQIIFWNFNHFIVLESIQGDVAEVVDPSVHHGSDQVFFGATVTYAEASGTERTITILGIDEADSLQGQVSWVSPIARTLLKSREGDELQLVTPSGVIPIEVLEVRYPSAA